MRNKVLWVITYDGFARNVAYLTYLWNDEVYEASMLGLMISRIEVPGNNVQEDFDPEQDIITCAPLMLFKD